MSALSSHTVASLCEVENQTLVLLPIDYIVLIEIYKNHKVNRRPVSQLFANLLRFSYRKERLSPAGSRLRDAVLR
jgi:hypothetical protein